MSGTSDTATARLNVALETERIISDGLNRGESSVLSHVTAPFLDDLWQAIRSRRLGPYGVPSPVEEAAARAFGTCRGNIQRALVAAEEEFTDPSETWGKPILAVLRRAADVARAERTDKQQCLACGTWLTHTARFCTNQNCPSYVP